MLPFACVCVPVLGVFIVGLLADYRYLDDLRRMGQIVPVPRQPPVTHRPVITASAWPAA